MAVMENKTDRDKTPSMSKTVKFQYVNYTIDVTWVAALMQVFQSDHNYESLCAKFSSKGDTCNKSEFIVQYKVHLIILFLKKSNSLFGT